MRLTEGASLRTTGTLLHLDGDSDPKLAAPANQWVNLPGIEQLGYCVDANILLASCLDDEDLAGGYVADRADEV